MGELKSSGKSVEDFEKDLKNNLYRVWNRMSSGSYFPPPVLAVEIPKPHGGGVRVLGVPTVADRVAQSVVAAQVRPSAHAAQMVPPQSTSVSSPFLMSSMHDVHRPFSQRRPAQWLQQVGLNSRTDLAGFIGLAGPYDFLPIESRTLRTIFGGANRAETQPISFTTGKEAPSLTDHGTARSPSQSRQQPQNGGADSRPWRCCRGTDLWRGRSSHLDWGLCARSASSGAGAARRHSIRLARHKQTGQFSQQSLGTMTPPRTKGGGILKIALELLRCATEAPRDHCSRAIPTPCRTCRLWV